MKPKFAIVAALVVLVMAPSTTAASIATVSSAPAATAPAAGPARLAAATCPALVCMKLKVEGTSRIARLGSDITLAPDSLFEAKAFFENKDPAWPLRIEGKLNLATIRKAYLVVLRFMPSVSDIDFIQDTVTGRGRIVQPPEPNQGSIYVDTEVTAKLFVKLSNVLQDGIDIHVGDSCRTQTSAEIPIKAVLKPEIGATVKTEATFGMPRFSGCGVTEDLDPLFSGLVSGPGNVLRSTLTVVSIGEA